MILLSAQEYYRLPAVQRQGAISQLTTPDLFSIWAELGDSLEEATNQATWALWGAELDAVEEEIYRRTGCHPPYATGWGAAWLGDPGE